MTISASTPLPRNEIAGSAPKPALAGTVKSMMGMLWYQMLSELNATGGDSSALGPGGGAFQSMFLQSVAENDFGKYDGQLTSVTMQQLAGRAGTIPAPAIPAISPADPGGGPASPALYAMPQADAPLPANVPAPDSVTLDQAASFARSVWPGIKAAAQTLGVPAVAILAQTALETGWGAAAAGNNLFGIKAVNGQTGTERPTQEMVNGVLTPQVASFRDYASPGASIADYISQITSAFPNVAGQSSIGGFAQALQAGGYATDNGYAAKIISISQSPMMQRVLNAIGTGTGATTADAAAIPTGDRP